MFFVDFINLYVSSGNGGNGAISFLNTVSGLFKKPDGGNGGKGGDVYFVGDKNLKTFSKLKYNINYKAENGFNGKGNCKTGKNGNDLKIKVPLGTAVYDVERNLFFGEILNDGEALLVLKGGRPGYGNFFLKSCEQSIFNKLIIGGRSKIMHFHLELKLLSDVSLLGFPNVGKSSFINNVSNVFSAVANYPFTTLFPIIGIVRLKYFDDLVFADLPGIIKNSCLGAGLGFNFLKHLLKTRLLLHIIDVDTIYSRNSFLRSLLIINNELKRYNINLFKVEKWLIFNKLDLVDKFDFNFLSKNILLKLNYTNLFFISSKNRIGLKKLCFNINEFFSLRDNI